MHVQQILSSVAFLIVLSSSSVALAVDGYKCGPQGRCRPCPDGSWVPNMKGYGCPSPDTSEPMSTLITTCKNETETQLRIFQSRPSTFQAVLTLRTHGNNFENFYFNSVQRFSKPSVQFDAPIQYRGPGFEIWIGRKNAPGFARATFDTPSLGHVRETWTCE